MVTTIQPKILKAREDIKDVLTKYNVTLPQVMGVLEYDPKEDDRIWKVIRKDYERVQAEVFKENYPDLWVELNQKKKRRS